MRSEVAVAARTGLTLLAGLGAIGTGLIVALSKGGDYTVPGIYGFIAVAAALGPDLWKGRAAPCQAACPPGTAKWYL